MVQIDNGDGTFTTYPVPNCTCSQCGETKFRIKVFNEKESFYVDENKKRWGGLKCPECNRKRFTEYDRAKGRHKSVDECTNENNRIGRENEKLVAAFLVDCGATNVNLTSNYGADIEFDFAGVRLKAEVKTVTKRRNGSYFVNRVSKHRRQDDFIFLVLDGVIFHMEEMNEYVQQTCACGGRTVTGLVRGAHKIDERNARRTRKSR